jgi:putative transposase
MGRIARIVIPGCWHHVTQRGNQQQDVFFNDSDRHFYLSLLRKHCEVNRVKITGYCLMGNHVHLIAVPPREPALAKALGRTHNEYARWLNLRRQASGHVWQNRYFSCPMDERHQWEALRYIELNPVRAGLVRTAADWPWSSTRAHLSGVDTTGLLDRVDWHRQWSFDTWRTVLENGVEDAALQERIREATRCGRPAGTPEFIQRLEKAAGRKLEPRRRGPKPKPSPSAAELHFEVV